jgi:hypothetical protein
MKREFGMNINSFSVRRRKTFAISKCSDKEFIDKLIERFCAQTEKAVKHTIEMCKVVADLHSAEKSGQINKHDIDYFCNSVKLRRNSSQYRKFICIGESAELFEKYIDRVPQAVSVLYEITTLDSDKFVNLIDNHLIDKTTTLHNLKILAGKAPAKLRCAQERKVLAIEYDPSKISSTTVKNLIDICRKLQKNKELKVDEHHILTLEKFLTEDQSPEDISEFACYESV